MGQPYDYFNRGLQGKSGKMQAFLHLLLLQEYKTYKENFLKRFQLTKLPPYLIFCIKRFTKNNFFVEKNPTIVNFPIT